MCVTRYHRMRHATRFRTHRGMFACWHARPSARECLKHAACTRSLRRWRKSQEHHIFVNHTCEKQQSGKSQSAAQLVVGIRGSVRAAIVCDKTKNDVERLCSHMTAAAALLAIPAANQRCHPKRSQSKCHLPPTTADAPMSAPPFTKARAASSRECSFLAMLKR